MIDLRKDCVNLVNLLGVRGFSTLVLENSTENGGFSWSFVMV